MKQIYDEAKAASAQLGALLNSVCDIIAADDSEIVFGFKYPIHADRAAAKTNLTVLGEIATRIMGRPLSVRCVQDDAVESWRQRETASRSPLARFAQEMGATVLSSTEQGPDPEA